MLKNYYEIDEQSNVASFLKEINEKKNTQYIILNTNPKNFVDVRSIAFRVKNSNEKLKNLKSPLPVSSGKNRRDYTSFLIKSGNRVIQTNDGYFDFIDALEFVLNDEYQFLKKTVDMIEKKEIYALNSEDKISTARNLFVKNNINLLPVIEGDEVIGEVRPMDFLSSELFLPSLEKSDLYSDKRKESPLNLPITNIMNDRPILIPSNTKIEDAIKLMIKKKIPSIIVAEGSDIYTVISHRDIFRMVREEDEKPLYSFEIIGTKEVYEDEVNLIENYAKKSMDKITKISDYDNLKINIKSLGNTEGTHMKKFSLKVMLSKGNKVLSMSKEIVQGTSDEEHNDKVKGSWNLPKTAQDVLKALEKKVMVEKKKSK